MPPHSCINSPCHDNRPPPQPAPSACRRNTHLPPSSQGKHHSYPQQATLLTLPSELRLLILSHLLSLPPYNAPPPCPITIPASRLLAFELLMCAPAPCSISVSPPFASVNPDSCLPSSSNSGQLGNGHGRKKKQKELHLEVLSVCRKLYAEGAAVLYGNTFVADEVLLTALPRLRPWYRPLTEEGMGRRVRRWHLRLQLDSPAPWPSERVTEAFTEANELVLQLWQSTFLGGVGAGVLQRFAGVRGVRRVSIRDVPPGFEGYAAWLERRMRKPLGYVGEEYICKDEMERKRLGGWTLAVTTEA